MVVSRVLKPLDIKFKNWWPELARQHYNTRRVIAPVPISSPVDNTRCCSYEKLREIGATWRRISIIKLSTFVTPGGATENSDEFSSPPDYRVVIFTSPWHNLVVSD